MAKRSRTRERRKEREQQRQRTMIRNIVIGVVVLAVVGLVFAIFANQSTDVEIPEDILERYDGIAVSQTVDGYYRMGSSDAPVRVEEYSSFSCPACENFHSTVFPSLFERVQAGEISFTYIPLQTGGIPNAGGAARSALCAGAQGRFWEMHDLLFEWSSSYGNNAFNQSRLTAAVDSLGLNSGDFNSCFNSSETDEILVNAQREGVSSTPSVAVNDTLLEVASLEAVNEAIDAALAFAPPVQVEEDPEPEATDEADVEATEEADMEATEEAMDDDADAEATEEAMDDDADAQAADDESEDMEAEATEEAMNDEAEAEATEEAMDDNADAEATEESESTDSEAEATEEAE